MVSSGCSIQKSVRKLAVGGLTDTFDDLSLSLARDDDPELVAEALPFALKTIEALLLESPDNRELLLAATSGYTQYAYAFVELEAERADTVDYARAEALRDRALNLYVRARGYGLRLLALSAEGIEEALLHTPDTAIAGPVAEDVAGLFWTGAAWGSAIGLALDQPEMVVDLPAVRALFEAALAVDPDWQDGTLHEAMIGLESLPESMGGSPERARYHFERAKALTGGQRAGTYVSWARRVAVEAQDRELFVELLETALAVDPDALPDERLANRIEQRHAAELLANIDEYFF